jgi:hypothetical protein
MKRLVLAFLVLHLCWGVSAVVNAQEGLVGAMAKIVDRK